MDLSWLNCRKKSYNGNARISGPEERYRHKDEEEMKPPDILFYWAVNDISSTFLRDSAVYGGSNEEELAAEKE